MSAWTDDELRRIGAAQELEIGVERDVAIEDAGGPVLDQVDAGYREKYGRYAGIVDSITNAEHRANTLRLVPRERG